MTKKTRLALLLCSVVFSAALPGCASMFMSGGTLVSRGYQPQRLLVSYQATGAVPAGVTYHLVETATGLAVFERSTDGSGTLFETRWSDAAGDHFAGWVKSSHGYEFVVPTDRTQTASGYVYAKGYYRVQNVDGVKRPVPTAPIAPVRQLIPARS